MLEAIKAAAIRPNIDIGSDNPGWRAGGDTREGVGPAVPRDMEKAAFGGLCLIKALTYLVAGEGFEPPTLGL